MHAITTRTLKSRFDVWADVNDNERPYASNSEPHPNCIRKRFEVTFGFCRNTPSTNAL